MEWFPSPPPAPEKPPPPPKQPAWIGPNVNELGVAVPVRLTLARSEKAAVTLIDVVSYRTGFEMQISMRTRHGGPPVRLAGRAAPGQPLADDVLRLGIEFSDGRRGTTIERAQLMSRMRPQAEGTSADEPKGPVLMERGGSGGDRRFDQRYWVWPLPSAGRLIVACEWPLYDIPVSTTELDAAPIIEAAGRSELLWENDEGGPSGGGWVASTRG